MRVIALTGPARAGKTTVAGMIAEVLGDSQSVRVEAFADRLKISAARALGFSGTPEELIANMDALKTGGHLVVSGGDLPAPFIVSGRQFLQRYGTEAHRDIFGPDFWIDAILPPGGRCDADVLVIHDLRFDNEARRVHDYGGEVWKIERPGATLTADHPSEAGIDRSLIDRVIVNDGSLPRLRAAVAAALTA